jgi:hypothetical protein
MHWCLHVVLRMYRHTQDCLTHDPGLLMKRKLRKINRSNELSATNPYISKFDLGSVEMCLLIVVDRTSALHINRWWAHRSSCFLSNSECQQYNNHQHETMFYLLFSRCFDMTGMSVVTWMNLLGFTSYFTCPAYIELYLNCWLKSQLQGTGVIIVLNSLIFWTHLVPGKDGMQHSYNWNSSLLCLFNSFVQLNNPSHFDSLENMWLSWISICIHTYIHVKIHDKNVLDFLYWISHWWKGWKVSLWYFIAPAKVNNPALPSGAPNGTWHPRDCDQADQCWGLAFPLLNQLELSDGHQKACLPLALSSFIQNHQIQNMD